MSAAPDVNSYRFFRHNNFSLLILPADLHCISARLYFTSCDGLLGVPGLFWVRSVYLSFHHRRNRTRETFPPVGVLFFHLSRKLNGNAVFTLLYWYMGGKEAGFFASSITLLVIQLFLVVVLPPSWCGHTAVNKKNNTTGKDNESDKWFISAPSVGSNQIWMGL